jgi:hypothetical protein
MRTLYRLSAVRACPQAAADVRLGVESPTTTATGNDDHVFMLRQLP